MRGRSWPKQRSICRHSGRSLRPAVTKKFANLNWQTEGRHAARVTGAVRERERAAVVFGDLAAEDEAEATAVGLRGKEWYEEIRGLGDSRPVVVNEELRRGAGLVPRNTDAGIGATFGALFRGGFDGVLIRLITTCPIWAAPHESVSSGPARICTGRRGSSETTRWTRGMNAAGATVGWGRRARRA